MVASTAQAAHTVAQDALLQATAAHDTVEGVLLHSRTLSAQINSANGVRIGTRLHSSHTHTTPRVLPISTPNSFSTRSLPPARAPAAAAGAAEGGGAGGEEEEEVEHSNSESAAGSSASPVAHSLHGGSGAGRGGDRGWGAGVTAAIPQSADGARVRPQANVLSSTLCNDFIY